MAAVMVDTSAIYALLDRSDNNHRQAVRILQRLAKERESVLLTNFIVAETHALILARLGADLARSWLQSLRWPVERVSAIDEDRARAIILTFTDKEFSYTDATTFAVMERLQLEHAFSFDRHFKQFGIKLLKD